MSAIIVKKDRYSEHKKEVCTPNNEFKPRHAAALSLCLLEEILENQKKCTCGAVNTPESKVNEVGSSSSPEQTEIETTEPTVKATRKKA